MSPPLQRFRHLGDREIYRGHVWTAVVGTFTTPAGVEFEREIVRTAGAVATVPISFAADDQRRERPLVTLIVQYRPAFDEALVEIPAGMRDVDGEADADNARRELAEEVGLAPGALEPLVTIYQNPGMSDAALAIFLARDCVPVGRTPQGPEEEHAEIVTVPLAEAIAWVESGRVRNATAMIGLLLAERRLRGA